MKKSRFNEHEIMQILKQAEGGIPVPELCRQYGMSSASFYKWRSKYGGMDASMIVEMKALIEENKRLKRMYADSQMECEIIKEAIYPVFSQHHFIDNSIQLALDNLNLIFHPGPTLLDIKVLPKTMTHDYASWWRTGDAQVAASSAVREAAEQTQAQVKKARQY